METQGSVRTAIRSQEWTVSIDIRDAYLHVPMHQAVRKYLCFVVNKKVYQFTCLPFGLATSPHEFTKLLRPVVALLRLRGVKLHVYLDDWLICADTPEQAQLHAQTTIRVLQFLSWIINCEKSDLNPSQDQFIGMQLNTRQFTVAPLPKMHLKVQSVHRHWMTNRHTIVHIDADDDMPAQVVRSQGDHVGSRPSARSAQHPGGFAVQSGPDTEHRVDDGHGASTTRVCQVGRDTGRLVCDIRQQMTHKFVSPYPDPRAEWTDAMSVPWDNGKGLLYAYPPFKMVPQVLQKIAQSPGVRVILIAPLQ